MFELVLYLCLWRAPSGRGVAGDCWQFDRIDTGERFASLKECAQPLGERMRRLTAHPGWERAFSGYWCVPESDPRDRE